MGTYRIREVAQDRLLPQLEHCDTYQQSLPGGVNSNGRIPLERTQLHSIYPHTQTPHLGEGPYPLFESLYLVTLDREDAKTKDKPSYKQVADRPRSQPKMDLRTHRVLCWGSTFPSI